MPGRIRGIIMTFTNQRDEMFQSEKKANKEKAKAAVLYD
jgi:hypothetical protein